MEWIIETDRLLLKAFSTEDRSAAAGFWGDSEVMADSGGATSFEALLRVLESYRRCHMEKGISVYGIIEKASGSLIGAAGFNVYDSPVEAELIYHFAKNSWGKGYATEAARACVELARQHPDVQLIHASCAPGNNASAKVLQKAGFKYMDTRWFEDTQQEEPYYEMAVK